MEHKEFIKKSYRDAQKVLTSAEQEVERRAAILSAAQRDYDSALSRLGVAADNLRYVESLMSKYGLEK